jgi:hypothetical protein
MAARALGILVGAAALAVGCRPAGHRCEPLPNDASPVAFAPRSGPPPTFTGGAIEDGLYRAVRVEGYGGVEPSGRRMTLAVSGNGTVLAWSGEVLGTRGETILATVRADARASATGNRLDLVTSCASVAPSPLPSQLAFTASPGFLVLGLVDARGAFVTTYVNLPR